MHPAILFKIMQRKLNFRNPACILKAPEHFDCTEEEIRSAESYVAELDGRGICYSYPGAEDYPEAFSRMKDPPLFFEYTGVPLWKENRFISVVGSREMATTTESWLRNHLEKFIVSSDAGIVSGGARGVDQMAHLVAIKNLRPTVFVLPSGLMQLYPRSLESLRNENSPQMCFLSEFEMNQQLHKHHFFCRNRLIAALGVFTLVAQASLKSGSLLTVHHCLEYGRPIVTIPAHPEMRGFEGNLKLMFDGCYQVQNHRDLRIFWMAESGLIRL